MSRSFYVAHVMLFACIVGILSLFLFVSPAYQLVITMGYWYLGIAVSTLAGFLKNDYEPLSPVFMSIVILAVISIVLMVILSAVLHLNPSWFIWTFIGGIVFYIIGTMIIVRNRVKRVG